MIGVIIIRVTGVTAGIIVAAVVVGIGIVILVVIGV